MISKTARLAAPACAAVLAAATAIAPAAPALSARAAAVAKTPRVATGGAHHVLGSSAQLTAVVTPEGFDTSYYFQWGTTTAYGNVTPTVHVGNGTTKVRVGKEIIGLTPGTVYHFRVVAIYAGGAAPLYGHDRTLTAKGGVLKFEVPKSLKQVVGVPFVFTGTLRGLGFAHHAIALQATAFPYREPFTAIAVPSATDALGRFSFRVANLTTSTAFRVVTLDPRPLYSATVIVHAEVRVVLHVRKSAQKGLVRLYGTVTPAAVGSPVLIQLSKPIKANRPLSLRLERTEQTSVFATQFSTVVKSATRTFSRFSVIVKVLKSGSYRAFVKMKSGGPLISGASANIVLRAGPKPKAKQKKKK